MTLVLASASKSRADVLRAAGVPFEIQPASIDEGAVKDALLAQGKPPAQIALALAEQKALQISETKPGALVLGADQVLDFDGRLLSKCESLEDVTALMKQLRGRGHVLISAVALARGGAILWRHIDTAQLVFRNFSDAFLAGYVAGEGHALLSSLGGYRLEGRGIQLFETIDGDYFSILGLPLLPVLEALRSQGEIAA